MEYLDSDQDSVSVPASVKIHLPSPTADCRDSKCYPLILELSSSLEMDAWSIPESQIREYGGQNHIKLGCFTNLVLYEYIHDKLQLRREPKGD